MKHVIVRPCPVKKALQFVADVHRRLPRVQGGMWAVSALIEEERVGVAIVGHPLARVECDPTWIGDVALEVIRVAVREGSPNACSALYGACARVARAMGSADLTTTIHQDEKGVSLIASGWVDLGLCGGGEWSRPGRPRQASLDLEKKRRFGAPWGKRARALRDGR